MKQEALKMLLAIARKKMAEGDESQEAPESPMVEAKEQASGEEAHSSMEELLGFLKSKAVPEPTSRMAAKAKVAPKAAKLFGKK